MFIVVAVNAVFVYFVKQASATRRFLHVQTYLPLVIISFLLFVPVIYGKFQLQKYESEIEQQMHAGHFVNSVLVQGNYSTKER